MNPKKILIIKPSSLGDIVQANPVTAALKAHVPGCRIYWLVFDVWQEALDLFTDIDGCIVWRKKGGLPEYARILARIRAERFDIVIDLQGLARTAILAALSGAPVVKGVPGMKELSWLIVDEVSPESRGSHAVPRSLETVRYLSGKEQNPAFALRVPDEALSRADELLSRAGIRPGSRIAGIVPSVRGRAKEWPADHYRELARMAHARWPDASLLVFGTRSDRGKLSGAGILDLCGETTLVQLAAFMRRCRVVIGGDTGPVHIASALGVPVICLFGGSDINETAPRGPDANLISLGYACSPCRGRARCGDIPCLAGIKPADVLKVAERYLDPAGTATAPAFPGDSDAGFLRRSDGEPQR